MPKNEMTSIRPGLVTPRSTRGDEEEPEEQENGGRPRGPAVVAMDLLRKQRTVLISEEVSPKLTQRLISSFLWLDAQSEDPIHLYINTPGGSADDGFAVFDMIRFVKSPVYCITVGLNASAGTIILLGAPKERRLALPNARLMIHQPSGGAQGTSSDIDITAQEIIKLRHRTNELIATETGHSVEQVEKDTDRDCWLSAEEARDYGLVSRIVEHHGEIL